MSSRHSDVEGLAITCQYGLCVATPMKNERPFIVPHRRRLLGTAGFTLGEKSLLRKIAAWVHHGFQTLHELRPFLAEFLRAGVAFQHRPAAKRLSSQPLIERH